MTTASIITLVIAAWLFGYVLGLDHGADEERRDRERK
jgi:hypothetical protein